MMANLITVLITSPLVLDPVSKYDRVECPNNHRFKIIYFFMGPWEPWAMILLGPRALGMGPTTDVLIHCKF